MEEYVLMTAICVENVKGQFLDYKVCAVILTICVSKTNTH